MPVVSGHITCGGEAVRFREPPGLPFGLPLGVDFFLPGVFGHIFSGPSLKQVIHKIMNTDRQSKGQEKQVIHTEEKV